MLELLVHRGMKSVVPDPVRLPAGGGAPEAELEGEAAEVSLFVDNEDGAANKKAEGGSPPIVSASPAFSA
jgi:hypothetical protein